MYCASDNTVTMSFEYPSPVAAPLNADGTVLMRS